MNAKSKRSSDSTKGYSLTRESLAKLKQRARRRGVWFSGLKQIERRLLDLTIRVVQRVRSFMLAKVVSGLVSRLLQAMESRVVRLIRTEGREMALRLSEIAVKLGYKAARAWRDDVGFMQYLVVNNLGDFRN